MTCELLAPAGDESSAYVALRCGADAVYLGLTEFSARASAENLDIPALARVARFAHLLGAKVYVALNTLVKDGETDAFFRAAREAWNAGADAILLQDIFLGKTLKEAYPQMTLHLSTQAGCCNVYGAEMARDFGFSRVVLARETPVAEIARISRTIETEAFVQGALCTAFSGQCYLSSFAGNNSGNRGRCKQPCRKRYRIDRDGFRECAYALSTRDLSLGGRLKELAAAGVRSLKIEGRLRRVEYVAAATEYYRALLDGAPAGEAFSRLKRAYNRGDYTEGLGFGQKNFLSRDVQGHIGERVGTVSLVGGEPFCASAYRAERGDGFKILRGGREVCGAAFGRSEKGGFFLEAEGRLSAGDEVRVTTSAADGRAPRGERARSVRVSLFFHAGEKPRAVCGDLAVEGETPLSAAKSAPLTAEEIGACFAKTGGLPLAPTLQIETEGAFLRKSELNDFRRCFYAALSERLAPAREPLAEKTFSCPLYPAAEPRTAVIARERAQADVVLIKPQDYGALGAPQGESFLYLPPFLTTEEADGILARARALGYVGVYCDGCYGLYAARKYGLSFFAGTGFPLTNRFSVQGVRAAGANYFALSKELSCAEQRALSAEGAFALSLGDVKVMDLIYCPFERTCSRCDRRERYTLTDEDGRAFPLRRYLVNGACRFEVYNCAPLAAFNGKTGALADCSVCDASLARYARRPEEAGLAGATKGHAERSFL